MNIDIDLIFALILVFGHFVLVPVGYLRIILFLKRQNKTVAGTLSIPKINIFG